MTRRTALALALGVALAACGEEPPRGAPGAPPGARFRFVDVAAEAGLTAPTWCGRPEKPHLLESGGCGLALLDHDGDGDLDLYLVNAWRLEGDRVAEKGVSRLYRNRGDGTFEDVTEASGAGLDVWGTGAAVGDPDGDGDPDLFVGAFGPDVLLENRGDGTFRRVPGAPGVDGWTGGACFFDADQDGDEDLYVAGYVDATLDEVLHARPTLDWKGTKVMLGPFGLEGEPDRFFRNEGGWRFVDATEESGLADLGEYFGFGVCALDADRDGDLDLYVANDSNPNYLYRNEGGGRFQEMGLWSGAAQSAQGASQASMGIAVGDYDGDLWPDLFVTHFSEDASTLYRNLRQARFLDVSAPTGVAAATYPWLQWGAAFADLDLDGDPDLAVASGHIYPQADAVPAAHTSYAMRNQLLENQGGRFVDVSEAAGPGFGVLRSSRGLAAGDLDGDGDLDLVVSNVDAPPSLLRNDSPRAGRWLLVDALGARRVEVEAGGRTFARERVAGESYLSANDPRFHVGLGAAERVERVRVVWPDGTETVRADVPADRLLEVAR